MVQRMSEDEQEVDKVGRRKLPGKFSTSWREMVCMWCGMRLRTWADSDLWRCGYCRRSLAGAAPMPLIKRIVEPIPTSRGQYKQWDTRYEILIADELQAISSQEQLPTLAGLVARLRARTGEAWLTVYIFAKDYCERHQVPLAHKSR